MRVCVRVGACGRYDRDFVSPSPSPFRRTREMEGWFGSQALSIGPEPTLFFSPLALPRVAWGFHGGFYYFSLESQWEFMTAR